MKVYLLLLTVLLWLPAITTILSLILKHTLFWQIKEYRFDRAFAEITYNMLIPFISPVYLSIRILLLLCLVGAFALKIGWGIGLVSAGYFTVQLVSNLEIARSLVSRSIARPRISLRNVIILSIASALAVVPFFCILFFIYTTYSDITTQIESDFQNISTSLSIKYTSPSSLIIPITTYILFISTGLGIALELLSFFLVSVGVSLTSPLAAFTRTKKINAAKRLIHNHKDLKVIGITGSYGKTTTKEFLKSVLSAKYNVAATPENHNTDIGIALAALNQIKKKTEFFIAEMGAYKKQEILNSTKVAPPDLSIVLAVGNSHIDIFGSQEKLAEAKSEIVKGAKESATIILNADDAFVYKMKKSTNKSCITYSFEKKKVDYLISDLTWKGTKCTFSIIHNDASHKFSAHIIGKHNIYNLVPTIVSAHTLGMSWKDISKALKETTYVSPHFSIIQNNSKATIIDDSYNSNEHGFLAALDALKESKKEQRIVVTRGIKESDSIKSSIYSNIGAALDKCATLLITSDTQLIQRSKQIEAIYAQSDKEIRAELCKLKINKDTALLIEGRVHPTTHSFILSLNETN
jgi:UDP-N-acetylmuramyl pentapeptide synthase